MLKKTYQRPRQRELLLLLNVEHCCRSLVVANVVRGGGLAHDQMVRAQPPKVYKAHFFIVFPLLSLGLAQRKMVIIHKIYKKNSSY